MYNVSVEDRSMDHVCVSVFVCLMLQRGAVGCFSFTPLSWTTNMQMKQKRKKKQRALK